MTTLYRDWAPTQFDCKGLGLDDRQNWYVAPHTQTRDSGCLARSNFRTQIRRLKEANLEHEVHRFGHWGPGWVEIVLVSPSDSAADTVESLECSDYPVLDDSDFSEAELEQEWSEFRSFGEREFRSALRVHLGCQEESLDILDLGALYSEVMREHSNGGEWSEEGGFCWDRIVCHVSREQIARLCLLTRADKRAQRRGFRVYDGSYLRREAKFVLSPATYERQHLGEDLTAAGVSIYGTLREVWEHLRTLKPRSDAQLCQDELIAAERRRLDWLGRG